MSKEMYDSLINLTPHVVHVFPEQHARRDTECIPIQPSGLVLQLKMKDATREVGGEAEVQGSTQTVPVCNVPLDRFDGLDPEHVRAIESHGDRFETILVSHLVAEHIERTRNAPDAPDSLHWIYSKDVLFPDTCPGNVLRDENGNIKGVRSLSKFSSL